MSLKKREIWTQTHIGKKLYEDCHYDAVHQEYHRIMANQKLGVRHGTEYSSEPPERNKIANTLTLDFWLPELRENQFLLLYVTE